MSAFADTYSGTEEPPEALKIDAGRLSEYLRPIRPDLLPIGAIGKFRGGQSNPTYLIETAAQPVVLRRKPPGKLIRGAHAIDREFRVISALHPAGFPVPKPFHFCTDEDVIGSEFYIVEHVAGDVAWDPRLPEASASLRAEMYDQANMWLARLHMLDCGEIGLADLGKGAGYAQRNLALWSDQYRKAETDPLPDMHWLMDALAERVPTEAPVRLIHGDYGLYNLIYAPNEGRIAAILDWEMATLGDPFIDFTHHLRPWWLEPTQGATTPTLFGEDLAALGVPDMETYRDTYAERMGLSEIPDWTWYLAYAQFRFAAMVQGVMRRYAEGTAANRRSSHGPNTVRNAAMTARRLLDR